MDQSGRSQVFGAVLLGTYGLVHGPLRVYALGGGGVYGLSSVRRGGQSSAGFVPSERVTRVSPAVSGGLGISVPVGSTALFGEGRVTYLSSGIGGTQPGVRSFVVPLVVGVRF